MRFVIVLALLCCCYAFEQTTSATQQEGHLPPQHIKDFVEQHVEYVKQQIPFIKQQINEGKLKNVEVVKPKINDQQVPENIKKFIELHITKVLQNFVQQKKQVENNNSSLDVPPFVVQKIEALKENIKNIIKQAETHIPQVINQQIAFKNQLKEKQQSENKEINNKPEVIAHNLKTRGITDNIQKIFYNEKEDEVQNQQHSLQVATQHVDKITVLSLVKEVVEHAYPLVAPVEAEHAAEVQRKEVPKKPLVVSNQTQLNIPQVLSQLNADDNEKTETEKNVIPSGIRGIVEQIHEHVPEVLNQAEPVVESHTVHTEDVQKSSVVPGEIQGAVGQMHQHDTQVINQLASLSDNKDSQDQSKVPQHIQGIVEQIHTHVPQVIDQKLAHVEEKAIQEKSKIPENIQGVVEQVQHLIPQVISQHADQVNNKASQDQSKVPGHVKYIVEKVSKHVPHAVIEQKTKEKDMETNSIIPEHVQGVVEHMHQHAHQIIEQQVILANQEQPKIPEHIQDIVEQAHQQVPQNINELKTQMKTKDTTENVAVPGHIQGIIQQIHHHIPQVINHLGHSSVPANIEGVVQQIHLELPQVISHGEDHVAQEQIYYFVPNQNVAHIINPEYVVTQIPTETVNYQSSAFNGEHIHPVVQTVNKLTQYEAVKNTNVAPSHVQQVQKEYHISPVRVA